MTQERSDHEDVAERLASYAACLAARGTASVHPLRPYRAPLYVPAEAFLLLASRLVLRSSGPLVAGGADLLLGVGRGVRHGVRGGAVGSGLKGHIYHTIQ